VTTTSKVNPRRRLMARFGVKLRKPDWQVWQGIQNVPLWKAVALSCDIEPNDLEGWRKSPTACIPPEIFRYRLEQTIAALSLNGGPLVSKPRGPDSEMHRVELGDFRAWAASAGLSLPDQFPAFVPLIHPMNQRMKSDFALLWKSDMKRISELEILWRPWPPVRSMRKQNGKVCRAHG
jgi:hypothetical protein